MNRDLEALKDADAEILRLVARRSRLAAKLRSGPKGRMDAATEKKLRASWEEKAARFGRDSRLAHDLFALLQTLEPPRQDDDLPAFQLAPPRKPVSIRMPAPADSVIARAWLALAAAAGQELKVERVPLTGAVVEGVKAVNALGGHLWWEENGDLLSRGGDGLTRGLDKVLHVGDDAFNLWLVLAFALGWQTRLKITGGSELQLTDLSSLSHFLPLMGARLTNVVPGRDGLPIRLECSGMLPQRVALPPDLPPGFVQALLLAAPFWDAPITFDNLPAAPETDAALNMLRAAGCSVTAQDGRAEIQPSAPGSLRLPSLPPVAMDGGIAPYILALPAMAGGEARLDGRPANDARAALAGRLLRGAGLTLDAADDHVAARAASADAQGDLEAPSDELLAETLALTPELFPLAAVLAARAMRAGKPARLPLPGDNPDDLLHALPGFLAQLSVAQDEEGRLIALPASENMAPVWTAPSAPWAAAAALGGFLRPAIRLSNPGLLTDWLPSFWAMYNSLPAPDFSPKAPVETADVQPARRRIIARDVYIELPPESPAGDDF